VVEQPLRGGRLSSGVVRVGNTVRRPPQPNSYYVRRLLRHLELNGFDGAPRYLGLDERGRETFTFIAGTVPADLDAHLSDAVLEAAARLIRRYHDATAGAAITGCEEVACHNDLSPCNFVFRNGVPVAVIDFDSAAPGSRWSDVGYAVFLWLNLGTDGRDPAEQARRMIIFCDAYHVAPGPVLLDAIDGAVCSSIERLQRARRAGDVEWSTQLEWLREHAVELRRALEVARA
jgi:Ser/Thr protein kinase RdoA (MazF antagonist)